MKRLIFLPFLLLVALLNADAQIAGHLPYEISLDQIASGFSSPIDIANAGDDRLFIVERSGRIRILNQDGSIQSDPFLDINDRVINTGGQSERGLLALEFHHAYNSTGWFFVHYSDNNGNTVISRFSVDPSDSNTALPDSERIIFTLEQPFDNHNGGSIKFGLDKMLYIGMGDGGDADDPTNQSQNRNSLLGKILRIDIDNGDPYAIPADNPFVNNPDVLDEIWAIGVRNPWKFSFDRVTGDMWMADVGQRQWEEINFQKFDSPGGENYGWRCREGNHDANTAGCNGPFEPAVTEYNHEGFTHCSVTGGYVYRGSSDLFDGAPPIYLYADYCSGTFWGAYRNTNDEIASDQMNGISGNAVSTFGEDANGELYMAALNNGRVYRVSAACNIDFDLMVSNATCDVSNDGVINVPAELTAFYELEIVNSQTGEIIADRNAVPAGNYEISVSRFGCSRVYNETVTLEPLEPVSISLDNATNTLSADDIPGASYQWFLNGELIADETSSNITVSENGIYLLLLTLENGCEFSSGDVEIGIEPNSTITIAQLTKIKIMPNPVDDILTLTLATESLEKFNLKITDVSGKKFYTQAIELQGQADFTIDMKDFANGVYLLIITDGQATQTEQIVKH